MPVADWRARILRLRSTSANEERAALAVLVLTVAVLGVLSSTQGVRWFPVGLQVIPLLLGGLALRRRPMALVCVAVAVAVGAATGVQGVDAVRAGNYLVLVAAAAVGLALSGSREELGLRGLRSDSMLLDLRERLRQQGEVPALPAGWRAEMLQTSAGGAGFGGDFLVSSRTAGGRRLELALVDVSGKGVDAGTRALLLSGALGGLLGAVPEEEFLDAANAYLLRQGWDEGFATAIHLSLDLTTGEALVQSAGHPPGVQYRAGSGQWEVLRAEGTVLGLLEKGDWGSARTRLGRGDALLLFTDGVIEVPGRDLDVGLDKLLGEANRLVVSSFEGGAATLISSVARAADDDQALVLLWRT